MEKICAVSARDSRDRDFTRCGRREEETEKMTPTVSRVLFTSIVALALAGAPNAAFGKHHGGGSRGGGGSTAVLAVAADSIVARKAEEDSTVAAGDTQAARVFGAGGQSPHGKRVVARPGDLVDWPLVGTAIRHTSEATWLARMARGLATPRPDEGWVALM